MQGDETLTMAHLFTKMFDSCAKTAFDVINEKSRIKKGSSIVKLIKSVKLAFVANEVDLPSRVASSF